MPHAGLINERALGPEAAELLRARIHFSSGKRKLGAGKAHEGMSTLFDAFLAGLRWYVASPRRLMKLSFRDGDDFNDEKVICAVLKRSGVLDRSFDYDSLCNTVERALDGDLTGVDPARVLRQVESLMTQLGIVPFDEKGIPSELPAVA